MRRSPANSTNRSLAAFGKLQHIRPAAFCVKEADCRPLSTTRTLLYTDLGRCCVKICGWGGLARVGIGAG